LSICGLKAFFEVFATVVIAFLFTRLELLRVRIATFAVIFSTIVFLTGGIIGTFHHLYFTGTSVSVLSLGAVFSALEVVPYILIAFEVLQNLSIAKIQGWVQDYRVIIYFFVAVAFWNLVGAGLFGFFINPPIALYYMQGLNTTPVHAHTALFGVYGMLGLALMLFCFKAYDPSRKWNIHILMFGSWALNIGLILEVLLSLLPVGLLQTWASVEHGLWYARSAEFLQTDLMSLLRWMRMIGDTVFAVGALAIGIFVVGLKLGWSYRKNGTTVH
jgi:nitric oxide reductase subunit B